MIKYTIILYHRTYRDFLSRLQDIGLVDISLSGWEPDETERELVSLSGRYEEVLSHLDKLREEKQVMPGQPFENGKAAFEAFLKTFDSVEKLRNETEQLLRNQEELMIWGDFSAEQLKELEQAGVYMHWFSCFTNDFKSRIPTWEKEYHIQKIAENKGITYFLILTDNNLAVQIDAVERKVPQYDVSRVPEQLNILENRRKDLEMQLARVVASVDLIRQQAMELKDELHYYQALHSGREVAGQSLVVLEAWAEEEQVKKVNELLDNYPDLIYWEDKPLAGDFVPVKLKNNKFSRLFEMIGELYSLPKYGTLDLTAFFAPFYMVFFGFCLGDGGYGIILLLAGLILKNRKNISPGIKNMASLSVLCGASTVVFGFLTGSFFGVQLAGIGLFEPYRDKFLTPDNIFYLALMLGIIQIIFGMILKIINISRQYGFRYSLGTFGWMVVVISSLGAFLLPLFEIGFSFHSTAYLIFLISGLICMLFFNSPGKNPLVNFGTGLWDTYNNMTGLLSDVLSYIRLFALCLSGSTLAIVFNDLAFGLSPDIPVVKQLFIVIILLLGHGITLFMSALGSMVHPMRLTFVEFYKNAGFESAPRAFNPFKRNKDK